MDFQTACHSEQLRKDILAEFKNTYTKLLQQTQDSGSKASTINLLKQWVNDLGDQNDTLLEAVTVLEKEGLRGINLLAYLFKYSEKKCDKNEIQKKNEELSGNLQSLKQLNREQEETIQFLHSKQNEIEGKLKRHLETIIKDNSEITDRIKNDIEKSKAENMKLELENECLNTYYEKLCEELECGLKHKEAKKGIGTSEELKSKLVKEKFIDEDKSQEQLNIFEVMKEIEELHEKVEFYYKKINDARKIIDDCKSRNVENEVIEYTNSQQKRINHYAQKLDEAHENILTLTEKLNKAQDLKSNLEETVSTFQETIHWLRQKYLTRGIYENTVDTLSKCSFELSNTLNKKQLRQLLTEKEHVIKQLTNHIYIIPELEDQTQVQNSLMEHVLLNENYIYHIFQMAKEELAKRPDGTKPNEEERMS